MTLACQTSAQPPLVVYAASSLQGAFIELAEAYMRATNERVVVNFAGSQQLRLQIEQGAPADVFAAADAKATATLRDHALVDADRVFACNQLGLLVAERAQHNVRELTDLVRADRLVLGDPQSPIGHYTQTILQNVDARQPGFSAAVQQRVVSFEPNAGQIKAKVALGEADAAIVYRSDGRSLPAGVRFVEVPQSLNLSVAYPVVIVRATTKRSHADAFIAFALSARGSEILRRHGFSIPTDNVCP